MTGRVRHRLVASMLVAALGTACGGGGTNRDVHPSATEPRGGVASRAGATRAATNPTNAPASEIAPPVRSARFDDVPSPPVVDRGDDRAAVVDSLVLYGRWLDRHHPDPVLATMAYLPGSTLARDVAADLAKRRRDGTRVIEVDERPIQYRVLSVFPNAFSVRATEYLARRERVNVFGQVLEQVSAETEQYAIVVTRFGPDAPWRINVVERQGPPIETQL